MKRGFILIAALLVACTAWAVQIETGANGQPVSTSNPLPVTVTSGGSSVSSVAPAGATSVKVESWTVTSSPSSWTMTASATDIGLWHLATTTVWLSFNSSGATVSQGIPLIASQTLFRDAAQGVVVWAVASVSQTITRAEGRR